MNHVTRAKGIIGRAIPKPEERLGGWYANFVAEFVRGLRRCERDARRHGIYAAANLVGDLLDAGRTKREIMKALVDLEAELRYPPPMTAARRRRV